MNNLSQRTNRKQINLMLIYFQEHPRYSHNAKHYYRHRIALNYSRISESVKRTYLLKAKERRGPPERLIFSKSYRGRRRNKY